MYAIIKTGGKQYKVAPGDVLEVEHLKGEAASFAPILVVTDEGATLTTAADLKKYPVEARIVGDTKGDKVTVFKYRNKSGYASKNGHRQLFSVIEITGIGAAGPIEKAAPSTDQKATKEPAAPTREAAPKQTAPEQSAAEQAAPEQPAAEQAAPEQPAPEQPAPEQPAPEQPAPEQPAPEQASSE